MMARPFSHPHFGINASIEVVGKEVHLSFEAHTSEQANDLAEKILDQMLHGYLELRMMGTPTSIKRT